MNSFHNIKKKNQKLEKEKNKQNPKLVEGMKS